MSEFFPKISRNFSKSRFLGGGEGEKVVIRADLVFTPGLNFEGVGLRKITPRPKFFPSLIFYTYPGYSSKFLEIFPSPNF